jgi:hypothetical protein
MKFENTKVMNFEGAFRGLRNPLNSWDKSDSQFGIAPHDQAITIAGTMAANMFSEKEKIDECLEYSDKIVKNGIQLFNDVDADCYEYNLLGLADLDLAHRMIKASSSERKFLRQIFVSVDITAPLYWWKEMDTYKVGTVANSTSTMHKLATTPITIDCFETDDMDKEWLSETQIEATAYTWVEDIIDFCETLRLKYLETRDTRYWKELIRWLPESWLQTRTWTANYEILRNIYIQRRNHKLSEWRTLCNWIGNRLPYAKDLILYDLYN